MQTLMAFALIHGTTAMSGQIVMLAMETADITMSGQQLKQVY
jgi:hypothetical protein